MTVDDDDDGDFLANMTSTLEVMVDDIPNGTNISGAIFRNRKDIIIYRAGVASILELCIENTVLQVPHLHHLM